MEDHGFPFLFLVKIYICLHIIAHQLYLDSCLILELLHGFGFGVAASFALENTATVALAVNLVTYFSGVMHFSLADAANQLTNYMGTAYILCIVVAFLADTYIGRFYAVVISAFIEFVVWFQKMGPS